MGIFRGTKHSASYVYNNALIMVPLVDWMLTGATFFAYRDRSPLFGSVRKLHQMANRWLDPASSTVQYAEQSIGHDDRMRP